MASHQMSCVRPNNSMQLTALRAKKEDGIMSIDSDLPHAVASPFISLMSFLSQGKFLPQKALVQQPGV